ncbi:MAG: hypothetical protein KC708_07905 [Anaerolineae bacterium]|nr:hypothetical protein [Anaerolineae bacterium]
MDSEQLKSFAEDVAKQLNEKSGDPVRQIALIAEHLGTDFVKENLDETLKIEAAGGMMTQEGERRRTPGGVFFYLVKGKMEPNVRQIIFPNFGQQAKGGVVEWKDRGEYVEKALADKGELRRVSITVVGRPSKVVIEENSVFAVFDYVHPNAPYPRGVPQPPEKPDTYVVYMSMKHWEQVADAVKNPKDELIVDGTISWDDEHNCLAVFSTRITTRLLEKRQRRQDRAKQETQKPKKTDKPTRKPEDSRVSSVASSLDLPEDTAAEIRKLEQAATTLRERIAAKTAKGQKASMEEKLLRNNERQIAKLKESAR